MNKRDGRFLLREKRIRQTLNALPKTSPVICITNSCFARKAKIGRATFYRHYKTIEEAFLSQRRELLYIFRHEAKHLKSPNLKTTFRFIIIFIYRHKDFFQNDFFHCDCLVTRKLFLAFQKIICAEKPLRTQDFDFYIYKITYLLKQWAKTKFQFDNIPQLLHDMLKTTPIK